MSDKINLLIVDDIKENHLVMESVLTDSDINIVKALSGEEALTLCMSHSFAVILMDVQMPGMDGFETADILRSIDKTKNIPIIFVTAISKEKKSISRGYELGAVDYLFKPIDPLILRSKVRFFIEYHKQKLTIVKQADELKFKVKELTQILEEKDRLETLSLEDPLTKVYNRRGVDKLYDMHWKNCGRYQLPISVLMLDLDNFKGYNDNYGHIDGDTVLKEITRGMVAGLYRPEDFVGRIGGEEFVAVLPNTDREGAEFVAKRIIEVINSYAIPHLYNDIYGIVTVSLGISTIIPSSDIDSVKLLETADKALYKAKNTGKNCFEYLQI
ncbi:MAG: diguanylate cyclase [Clostridiales bacterium]|nr:diguanylate cyclase [Clostridiales bacterium]